MWPAPTTTKYVAAEEIGVDFREPVLIAHVDQAHFQLVEQQAAELVAQELLEAQQALGGIVGKTTSDDLLGQIFANFCIGK